MKTNREKMISYDRQLKKAMKKLAKHSAPKKTASPYYRGRDNMRAVRPIF